MAKPQTMNKASKQKWAAIIRLIIAIVTLLQTILTAAPPVPVTGLAIVSACFTLIVTSGTALVNWLSPDIDNVAAKISIWIAIGVIVTAMAEFVDVIHFNENIAIWVKWSLSSLGLTFTMLGKQIFPSELFKQRRAELKKLK